VVRASTIDQLKPPEVSVSPTLGRMATFPNADPPIPVKLGDLGEIAAAIPHIVGFVPEESLVVMSMRASIDGRDRVGLTMRFDLPPERYDAELAEQIAIRLAADKADFALVACWTEEQSVGGEHPRTRLIDLIGSAIDERDMLLRDALLVRSGRWWSYLCDDPDCHPAEGSPIPEDTDIAAAHAMAGRRLLPGRSAMRDQLRPVEHVARRAMEQAIDAAHDDVVNAMVEGGLALPRAETVALAQRLLDRYVDPRTATLTDAEAARLIAGFVDVQARDQVLSRALDGDLDVMQRLLIDLCRRAIPPKDAPTCTLLAAVAYARGDGGLANVALERALNSDPSYSLANLLSNALYQQVPPSALRAAWSGLADTDGDIDEQSHEPQKPSGRKKRRRAARRH
jgi:hypothetical protein